MNFDEIIDRRGHLSSKWDMMEKLYGVPADDGLAMWVADMDFRSPDCVQDAVRAKLEHGIYGYLGDYSPYTSAIQWWMKNRHGWEIEHDWILTTTGLCNGVGIAIDTLTNPGDAVVLFTPVYHAFARIIRSANRNVVECPLVNNAGRYEMDFDAYEPLMTGKEKMLILCSPHNPGGRVWSKDELRAVGDFARRHDLLVISDEVHHDLVFSDHQHTAMPLADPGITDRLIMLTAPSKTFNTAGSHCGQMIVSSDTLRGQLKARMTALSLASHDFGVAMTTGAYSAEGAAWVDELVTYLDGNRRLFDEGVNAIPGISSMNLESTYLSWVDFSGTGMSREEYKKRVNKGARIAVNYGSTFGTGGETFLRFNVGMPRARIIEAVERLQAAFSDLQ